MRVFLVKKEFGVYLSTTNFCLHEGDIAYSKGNDKPYFYMVEYSIKGFDGIQSRYKFNIPINLNESIWCYKTHKRKKIQEILSENYIEDITSQYNRDEALKMLL